MLFTTLIGALLVSGIAFSTLVPSDETLRIAFDRGQRFYVIEDYVQAIDKFEVVKQAEDSRFVDETQVLIQVGELDFPVKVAATFQLANSHRNLAVTLLDKAARERKQHKVDSLQTEARENFLKAATYYKEAAEITDLLEIRVLSQYQLIKTNFQSEDYLGVIDAAQVLIDRFPESDYVDEALYEMGWAHYNLQQFDQAIAAFGRLDAENTADYRIDRAQFQVGKSYYEQGKNQEARDALGRLVGKYDFSYLSDADRVKMEAQKLSGVVKETALELVAKAQLLIGDTYTTEGDVEAAETAYRRVIEGFSQERNLVEDAYVKIGRAHIEGGDLESGAQVYRRSIDEVSDPGFRARMQARVGRAYYENKAFEKALTEYGIYINAYGQLAREGGLGLDRAHFQMAQSLFELGEEKRRAGETAASAEYFSRSEAAYRQVVSDFPTTDLQAESLFGAGLAAQQRGGDEGLETALDLFGRIRSQLSHRADMANRAHLQMARIHFVRKEYASSAAEYESYLEQNPDSKNRDQLALELALVYRDAQQFDEAYASIQSITAGSKVWQKAGLMGGEFLLRQGRLPAAANLLQQALDVYEEEEVPAELYYVQARVRFEQGEFGQSVDAFTKTLEHTDKAGIAQGARLGRGTAYYQMDDFPGAIADLEALLTEQPPATMKDQAHRLLGQCYVKMGRRAEAIEDYQAIIEASQDPRERAEFRLLLAELYYSLERYEETIENCRLLLDDSFEDSPKERGYLLKERAYFVIGDSYTRLEDNEKASQTFAQALQRYPRSSLRPDLLFGQAVSTFALGESDKVIPLLEDFINAYPTNPNRENAYYFLAYAHLQETKFERAAHWFGRLVDEFPNSQVGSEALFQKAENLFNLGRFDEAAQSYQVIIADHTESEFVDNANYNLGWCFFELERKEEAITQFSGLLERFPNSPFAPSAQFTLGDYYFNQKAYDDASVAYKKVVAQYPQSDMVVEAKELLVELEEIQAYLKYENAMALFDSEQYDQAAVALREVVTAYPSTETRAGAMANLGMSYEFLRQWKDAAEVYEDLVESYGDEPQSTAAVVFAQEHLNWIVKNRL
ncbi:MAG: tetratricopeptide repeat protein [Candidatus Latescibacteria bacterium]|nr:tetratricopeptide repeat protein [Candidatus Latescibacterota bacterium]